MLVKADLIKFRKILLIEFKLIDEFFGKLELFWRAHILNDLFLRLIWLFFENFNQIIYVNLIAQQLLSLLQIQFEREITYEVKIVIVPFIFYTFIKILFYLIFRNWNSHHCHEIINKPCWKLVPLIFNIVFKIL